MYKSNTEKDLSKTLMNLLHLKLLDYTSPLFFPVPTFVKNYLLPPQTPVRLLGALAV